MNKKIKLSILVILIVAILNYCYLAYLYSRFDGHWINLKNNYEYKIKDKEITIYHHDKQSVVKYKISLFNINLKSISTPNNIIFIWDTEEFSMPLIAKEIDENNVYIISKKKRFTSNTIKEIKKSNQRIELMTLLRKVHHLDPQSYTAHPQRSTTTLMVIHQQ